jgi:hypothetical protein
VKQSNHLFGGNFVVRCALVTSISLVAAYGPKRPL